MRSAVGALRPRLFGTLAQGGPKMRFGIRALLAAAAWAVGAVVVCGQTTYYVNADCGNDGWTGLSDVCDAPDGPKLTIQAAIDAAASGDEVVLADGVYGGEGNRDNVIDGKALTVRSVSGDPELCVIDCMPDVPETISWAIEVLGVAEGQVEISGLTIANCYGEYNRSGITGRDSDLIVTDSVFRDNSGEYSGSDCAPDGPPPLQHRGNGSLQVRRCRFFDNDTNGDIYSYETPVVSIVECWIHWGVVSVRRASSVEFSDNFLENGDCSFRQCDVVRIHGNDFGPYSSVISEAQDAQIISCSFSGPGRGLDLRGDRAVVQGCQYDGGKVSAYVRRCGSDSGLGAAISVATANAVIANCTFISNTAEGNIWGGGSGGAVWIAQGSRALIANCTFFDNYAFNEWDASYGRGGAVYCDGTLQSYNSVFWENRAFLGSQIGAGSNATVELAYCDVQGGESDVYVAPNATLIWGDGMLDADPMFVDPDTMDLRLTHGSRCVDSGSNLNVPQDVADLDGDGDIDEPIPLDLDEQPRFVDDPRTIDTGINGNGYEEIIDMGAYELPPSPRCIADFNYDGRVNTLDVIAYLQAYNARDPAADLNLDGVVNIIDFLAFLNAYNDGCP